MSRSPDDVAQIDTAGEDEAEILLADPDDYHRAQRLKEIHSARQQVQEVMRDVDSPTTHRGRQRYLKKFRAVVVGYVTEIEPLIEQTDHEPELPEHYPWDSVTEFADLLGEFEHENERTYADHRTNVRIFRACNKFLAEVKPLITEDEAKEWQV